MNPQHFWEGGLIPQFSLKNEGWAQQNDWDVASMLNMVWGYGLSSLGVTFLLFFWIQNVLHLFHLCLLIHVNNPFI